MQESEFRHSERRERATHAFAATVGSGICWVLGSTSILIIASGFRGRRDFELGLPGALESGFKRILVQVLLPLFRRQGFSELGHGGLWGFGGVAGDHHRRGLQRADFAAFEELVGGGERRADHPVEVTAEIELKIIISIIIVVVVGGGGGFGNSRLAFPVERDDGGGKQGARVGEERDVISINAGEEGIGGGGARAGGGTAEEQVDRALRAGRCAYVGGGAVAVVPVSAYVQRRRRRRRHHFRLHLSPSGSLSTVFVGFDDEGVYGCLSFI